MERDPTADDEVATVEKGSWRLHLVAHARGVIRERVLAGAPKNHKNDKSSVSPDEAKSVPYSRQDRWIGEKPVATQQ